jgi:hypothetical protein
MNKLKSIETQIEFALRLAEKGIKVAEVLGKKGIIEVTLYKWNKSTVILRRYCDLWIGSVHE